MDLVGCCNFCKNKNCVDRCKDNAAKCKYYIEIDMPILSREIARRNDERAKRNTETKKHKQNP